MQERYGKLSNTKKKDITQWSFEDLKSFALIKNTGLKRFLIPNTELMNYTDRYFEIT
jgi:hypothetical protein